MAVVLAVMAAFAIDISRMQTGTNELQTAADAAALRGALRLQNVPATNPSDSIIAFAARNSALNASVTVTTDDIRPAYWVDSTKALDTTSITWATANAVQVTARQPAGLLFGRLIRVVAPVPVRRGVAWIGNLASSTCIKPWGMPMASVLPMVGGSGARALTQTEVDSLKSLSLLDRTIIVGPPYSGNGQTPPPTPNGNWAALRVNGNGMSQYQDAVEDDNCSNNAVNVGPKEKDKPGNNLDNKTTESIDNSVCNFKSNDDTCYADAATTSAGSSVLVAFMSTPVSSGTETVQVYMLGELVVQCYRRENNGSNTCVSTKVTGAQWRSYGEGTLLGYINPDVSPLGSGTKLGNTVSTAQKIILVK